MAKSISCSDTGKDCNWSATADTVDELLKQVTEHVLVHHKEIEINDDSISEIKALMKEV